MPSEVNPAALCRTILASEADFVLVSIDDAGCRDTDLDYRYELAWAASIALSQTPKDYAVGYLVSKRCFFAVKAGLIPLDASRDWQLADSP